MGGSQSQQRNERTVTQPEENATNTEEKKESWLDKIKSWLNKMKRNCFPPGYLLMASCPVPPNFYLEKMVEIRQQFYTVD